MTTLIWVIAGIVVAALIGEALLIIPDKLPFIRKRCKK